MKYICSCHVDLLGIRMSYEPEGRAELWYFRVPRRYNLPLAGDFHSRALPWIIKNSALFYEDRNECLAPTFAVSMGSVKDFP